MIPKVIHYCWLSNDPLPAKLQKCMDSWKHFMPDYEIKRWSTENFDIHSVPLVEQAYSARKWAFAADYIRLYALYTEGGVYLDSDVMLYGDLSELFDLEFISAVEYHPSAEDVKKNTELKLLNADYRRATDAIKVWGIGIQAAVLAATKGHPFLKKCMDFYSTYSLEMILNERLTAPTVLAYNAEEFNFTYVNKEQILSNSIHLYPTSLISNYDQKGGKSIAIHWCFGSWIQQTKRTRITKYMNQFIVYRIARNLVKRWIFR